MSRFNAFMGEEFEDMDADIVLIAEEKKKAEKLRIQEAKIALEKETALKEKEAALKVKEQIPEPAPAKNFKHRQNGDQKVRPRKFENGEKEFRPRRNFPNKIEGEENNAEVRPRRDFRRKFENNAEGTNEENNGEVRPRRDFRRKFENNAEGTNEENNGEVRPRRDFRRKFENGPRRNFQKNNEENTVKPAQEVEGEVKEVVDGEVEAKVAEVSVEATVKVVVPVELTFSEYKRKQNGESEPVAKKTEAPRKEMLRIKSYADERKARFNDNVPKRAPKAAPKNVAVKFDMDADFPAL